ncbi:MAG: DUF1232 domain-containing protein [Anaerolineae bacterium]|nr:DUF1232 domain-containing protein [Anaerolineae bacterium]
MGNPSNTPDPGQPPHADREHINPLTTPLSARGFPKWLVYSIAVLGVIYLLNPTAGIIELLPDNLPIVGNLDEAAAFFLVWAGLVEIFQGDKQPPEKP